MSRRKDNPRLQAAKGYPGRRKKQVEAEINAAVDAAENETVSGDDPFPLPAFFTRAPAHWQTAIQIWNELSDVLRAAGRRRPGYRGALARYCALSQKYHEALDQLRKDLPKGGVTVKVVKGDGQSVFRTHPSIDFMGKVGVELRLIEHEFGFTPRSDSDLTRVESFNVSQGKLPFGGHAAPGQKGERSAPPPSDPADLMGDADSVPPGETVQ